MQQETKSKEFDLVVTHRDEKTGLVTHTNPYTLRVVKLENEEKAHYFERPVGSGNLWNKAGDAIGRWIKDEKGKGKYIAEAKHINFIPPETQDAKVAREVIETRERNKVLEAELAALKAEKQSEQQSKKAAVKPS